MKRGTKKESLEPLKWSGQERSITNNITGIPCNTILRFKEEREEDDRCVVVLLFCCLINCMLILNFINN